MGGVVQVTGKVEMYQGKPEIVVEDMDYFVVRNKSLTKRCHHHFAPSIVYLKIP